MMRFRTTWSRLAVLLVVFVAAVAMAVPQSSRAGLSPDGVVGDSPLIAKAHEAGQAGASYAPEPTSTPQATAITTGPSRAEYDSLMEKAVQAGAVRVIVGVAAPFLPEGQLSSPQAANAQQAAIAQAQDALLGRLSSLDASVVARFTYIPFVALEVDSAALTALYGDASVTSIQEDIPEPPDLAESVPLIGATNAWTSGYTGAGWKVAILDTGVDGTHPFLAGKVVSEACYSTTDAVSGTTTVCPNGLAEQVSTGAGVNCDLSINGCNHGTHVAGIVAGHSYSGVTSSGVAKDASIIAIQVFSRATGATNCPNGSPCALAYVSDQVKGLERIYAQRGTYNISSVDMSLGGGRYYNQTSCDAANASRKAAIDNLRSVNIATVISSGNSGYTDSMGTPGCISSAVSVGATDKADAVATYSNSASFLALLAPGSAISSSVPGGGFSSFNGTSMAAPHVAGTWAILKQAVPGASVSSVLSALQTTGLPVLDTRNALAKPRIKVDQAANLLVPTTPSPTATSVTPTVTPTTCPITLNDDFSNPASGWGTLNDTNGAVGYLNGQYQILVKTANWFYWAYPSGPSLADFTAEIDATAVGQANGMHGIAFSMDGSNMYAYVVGNGTYSLRRWDPAASNWVMLIADTTSPYVNSGTQSNHLKVARSGSTITIYANGHQLGQTTDSTLGSGHVGLLASAGADNYDVRFDNYVVAHEGCAATPVPPTATSTPVQTLPHATCRPFKACSSYRDADDRADHDHRRLQQPRERVADATSTPSAYTSCDYVSGEYQVLIKQVGYWRWCSRGPTIGDFNAEVDVHAAAHHFGSLGLAFNASSSGSYFFYIDDYYGVFTLIRYDSAASTYTSLIGWSSSSAIHTGSQTNRLKVVRRNPTISLYINDQPVGSFSDGTYGIGYVGALATTASNEQPNYDARYDNFVLVYNPNGPMMTGSADSNASGSASDSGSGDGPDPKP